MINSIFFTKRVSLCLVMIFLATVLSFSKDKKVPYVILTLKDSTVVEGYLRSSSLTDRDLSIKVNTEIEGKSEKYKICNIEKMEMKLEKNDSLSLWKPMFVNNGVGKDKGYISENQVMLLSTYRGENVNGYIGQIWCLVNPLTGLWEAVPCFYYQFPDMNYANCFLIIKGIIYNKRIKQNLMKEFANYPELVR